MNEYIKKRNVYPETDIFGGYGRTQNETPDTVWRRASRRPFLRRFAVDMSRQPVSYTHLTLPTTPYV